MKKLRVIPLLLAALLCSCSTVPADARTAAPETVPVSSPETETAATTETEPVTETEPETGQQQPHEE